MANFFDKVNKAFRGFDKTVLRPIGHGFRTAGAFLDKTIPGWSVLASLLTPIIPIAPLLSFPAEALADVATSGGLIAQSTAAFAGNALSVIPGSEILRQAGPGTPQIPQPLQQELAREVRDAAEQWATKGADALRPIQVTLGKAVDNYRQQGGELSAHLEALGLEIASGVALALSVATIAGAGVGVLIAKLALQLATTGYRVEKARELAVAIKKEARRIANEEIAKANALAAEEQALLNQLRDIRLKKFALLQSEQAKASTVLRENNDAFLVLGVAAALLLSD